MENLTEENYLAEDGFIHVNGVNEVFYMGNKLSPDNSESVTAIKEYATGDLNDERFASIFFEKDGVTTGFIVDGRNEEEPKQFITVDDLIEVVVYSDGELNPDNVVERRPTNCRSHNVVDLTPSAPPRWWQQVQVFAHNFWYCEYHL